MLLFLLVCIVFLFVFNKKLQALFFKCYEGICHRHLGQLSAVVVLWTHKRRKIHLCIYVWNIKRMASQQYLINIRNIKLGNSLHDCILRKQQTPKPNIFHSKKKSSRFSLESGICQCFSIMLPTSMTNIDHVFTRRHKTTVQNMGFFLLHVYWFHKTEVSHQCAF